MISHKHKCIFVEVPKTRSTSVRAILGKAWKPHLNLWQIKQLMEASWTNYGGRKNRLMAALYLLVSEERLLSVLRWILEAIPPANRWFPVFSRYVDQIADRVRALGGNPDLVYPSPRGEWKHPKEVERCITGKVCEVVFDCFGDFEGFVLGTCSQHHSFKCREQGVAKLVVQACKDRLLISVCLDGNRPGKIERIIIRC